MPNQIKQLALNLGEELKKRKWMLTTAESCTGGGLAYYITHIPGSSEWFDRGFVTYTNSAKKEMLGVQSMTLDVFGAVSEQTAREMSEGALKNSQAQMSIAITGIAGPDGGTPDKPVGTVWFAWSRSDTKTKTAVDILNGTRQEIRKQSITFALEKLIEDLRG